MQWLAIVILAGIAVWIVLAVRSAKKRKGSCGGDCSHCAGGCKNEQ